MLVLQIGSETQAARLLHETSLTKKLHSSLSAVARDAVYTGSPRDPNKSCTETLPRRSSSFAVAVKLLPRSRAGLNENARTLFN